MKMMNQCAKFHKDSPRDKKVKATAWGENHQKIDSLNFDMKPLRECRERIKETSLKV